MFLFSLKNQFLCPGIVKCRFERSTLPEHEGRRVVVARCLQLVEPPVIASAEINQIMDPLTAATYTPIPGQLLKVLPRGVHARNTQPQPWSVDISEHSKSSSAPAFRLLW